LHAGSSRCVLPKLSETFILEVETDQLLVQKGARARTVRETQSEYSEFCLPNDANTLGNMLGGHVMHLVDLCGAIAAMRHARCPVVTASVDQMTFLHPVRLGELVRLRSQVNRVFRTSMEIGVKVWVENLHSGDIRHTSSAYLTFVAVDAAGNRVLLPQIVPETEDEKRRFEEAAERRAYRLAFKDKTKRLSD
jgi:acyl-CoA hydrolase